MFLILLALASYLIGSIPFGYLIARWRGVDIFEAGSGNIGATNVGRVLGRKFGAIVFALDVLKGAAPVLLARWAAEIAAESWPGQPPAGLLEVVAGSFAFLGHLFPVYLRFRGGKGVATGAGVVAVLVPGATLAAAATWLLVVIAFGYVSLASMAAAIVLALAYVLPMGIDFLGDPRATFCLAAAALVLAKHHGNIARLWRGTENRIKGGASMFALAKVIHVLALGLWFGAAVFFSFVVAPMLFSHFEALGQKEARDRPPWFPQPKAFAKADDAIQGPREQGTLAAGYAVGPLFPAMFILQAACGFSAIACALSWLRTHPAERIHRWRVIVLLLGLSSVLAGWPIENRVRSLQGARHTKTLTYLVETKDADGARADMVAARKEFAQWHLLSLGLNLLAIVFVTIGMALTAYMPGCLAPASAPQQPHQAPA